MRRAWAVMAVAGWLISAGSLPAQVGYSFSFGTGPVGGIWGTGYPYQIPYGAWGPGFGGPIILQPMVIPAETMYGPLAVQRFMGIDGIRTGVPPIIITDGVRDRAVDQAANRVRNDAAEIPDAAGEPRPRVSNAAARANAARFMDFGDANFHKQDYNAAYERYRTAAKLAPDLAAPFLRQALALVAFGRYERAADTLRRALRIEGNPDRIRLRLDELYANNAIAKTAHLEALALAVEQNSQSADLMLVLGMYLFLDGKADRATPVFLRCSQLGGNEDGVISGFLPRPAKVAATDKEI